MFKRRRDDEYEEVEFDSVPPPPEPVVSDSNYSTWDGLSDPWPEWYVEVWVDGRWWYGKLWNQRSRHHPRTDRSGGVQYDGTKEAILERLAALHRNILRTESSRTFYVLPSSPPPPEEDYSSLH